MSRRSQQFLKGISVNSPTGDSILLQNLWKDQIVIIKIFRRFGCPICRYEAHLLSEEKEKFDQLNVKVIGIGFETTGLQEFIDGKFWAWDIFLDSENILTKALQLNRLNSYNVLPDVFSNQTKAAVVEALNLNIYGDFSGDLFRLGATFVVGPKKGLMYKYIQSSSSKFASVKELYKVCGGNPDLVEDLAPMQCIQYQNFTTPNQEPDCFVPDCMEAITA